MIQVSLDGSETAINESEFLRIVFRLIQNTTSVARSIYNCYLSGALDLRDSLWVLVPTASEFEALEDIITHQILYAGVQAIDLCLEQLRQIDDRITRSAAKYLRIPDQQGELREAVHRSIKEIRDEKLSLSDTLQKWMASRKYQTLVEEAHITVFSMQQTLLVLPESLARLDAPYAKDEAILQLSVPLTIPEAILAREPLKPIQRLYTVVNPNIEHQIEMADQASNPRVAIDILEKALKRAKKGVEVGKICLSLGMRHEELHNDELAIAYFTRAINEIDQPIANILLWRGQAHLRLGHLSKAKADLEQAISLGLMPQFDQDARQKLAQIE